MDFRVTYLTEARKCLRYVEGQNVTQPQFWANLLGAIANATIASVPDSVLVGLVDEQDRQRRVYHQLKGQLSD